MTLREELIQVAAVAVAIIEDIDFGEANAGTATSGRVLLEVFRERHRQDEKWGPQSHDAFDWMMILMEEVGEATEEIEPPKDELLSWPFVLNTYDKIVHAGQRARLYLEEKFGE